MFGNKFSTPKLVLILFVLFTVGTLLGMTAYLASVRPPVTVQPTITPTVSSTPTPILTPESTPAPSPTPIPNSNIDTSDWKTYKNEKYGFEFKYPKKYETNKIYSLWIDEDDGSYEWGVNKWQLTILGIQIYSKEDKATVLHNFGSEVTDGQQLFIGNNVAKELEGDTSWYVLTTEKENYIYVDFSSFYPRVDDQEYNEYRTMLSTFKFMEK